MLYALGALSLVPPAILGWTDAKFGKLKNVVLFPAIGCAIIFALVTGQAEKAAIGFGVALVLGLALFFLKAIAFGDVKYLLYIGVLFGGNVVLIFLASIYVYVIYVIIFNPKVFVKLIKNALYLLMGVPPVGGIWVKSRVPFGPFLSVAVAAFVASILFYHLPQHSWMLNYHETLFNF